MHFLANSKPTVFDKLCSWLGSFLTDRVIHVVVDGVSSDSYPINAGVPQGSVLSPTLFLLHINDLLSVTQNSLHCFADDSTLHSNYTSAKPISSNEARQQRSLSTQSLISDLNFISRWGADNLVMFNASKTQACIISNKKDSTTPPVLMDNQSIKREQSFSLVGVTFTNNLIWHKHISNLAQAASKKLSFLFRAKQFFSSENLLTLYKSQIRPTLEYCSHIWGSAPKSSLQLLDSIQNRAMRLINDPELTKSLPPLSHRRAVGDLSLFYRYFFGDCSAEISSLIPPIAVARRNTRSAFNSHPYCVKLNTSRTAHYDWSFFPRVSKLWNSLPASIFPPTFNLSLFKSQVNKHLLQHPS